MTDESGKSETLTFPVRNSNNCVLAKRIKNTEIKINKCIFNSVATIRHILTSSPGSQAPRGQSPPPSAVCTRRERQPDPRHWSASGESRTPPGWGHSSPSMQSWGAGGVCLTISGSRPSGRHSEPLWILRQAVTGGEKTTKAVIANGLQPISYKSRKMFCHCPKISNERSQLESCGNVISSGCDDNQPDGSTELCCDEDDGAHVE